MAEQDRESRLKAKREAQRLRNERRLELGLCVHCETPTGGAWRCAGCAADLAARLRERGRMLREAGCCTECKAPGAGGKWLCSGCTEKRAVQRKLRERRVANG